MSSPVEHIRSYHADLKRIRHDLHAHPELGYQEQRTSDIVAERLAAWGIEVHRGIAKTSRHRMARRDRTPGHRPGTCLHHFPGNAGLFPIPDESCPSHQARG